MKFGRNLEAHLAYLDDTDGYDREPLWRKYRPFVRKTDRVSVFTERNYAIFIYWIKEVEL